MAVESVREEPVAPGAGVSAAARVSDPSPAVPVVPETSGYRVKKKLLGPPLASDDLDHQRLGRPTALAVFASDNLSSSAYATEEILRTLIPIVGVAAFALVVPITVALLVLLGFLILSYRQTIKEYPSAGGAYIVTKDNFGKTPALVAGVSLLTDYILTVAVSVAAGTAALASAVPAVAPLRSADRRLLRVDHRVREPARCEGVGPRLRGAHVLLPPQHGGVARRRNRAGWSPVTCPSTTCTTRAPSTTAPRAAASSSAHRSSSSCARSRPGGAAVTGVEAISNGVPAFKEPAWKNARSTLVIMGSTLGVMFLGISILAAKMHVTVYSDGTPTVISQVGKFVFGSNAVGHVGYLSLQAATLLILVLAANTSFADFPRLASFAAGDHFMPRQLTKRGHRLVFSNGIISLAGASILVLLADRREGEPAHPALRARCVHELHALAGRHGASPHPAQGAGLEDGALRQRFRRVPHVRRRRDHRDREVRRGRVGRSSCSSRSSCSCCCG